MEKTQPRNDISVKPLQTNTAYLLEFEDQEVLALRLPAKIAKQLSGQRLSVRNTVSRLKAKLRISSETEQWFTITNVDNPLLEQADSFETLMTKELTRVTGNKISKSDLAISVALSIAEVNEEDEDIAIEQGQTSSSRSRSDR
ncbi:MAG TPA: hypothetical protein VLV31_05900 [Candidatus Acidoferrales bacterium]|nr:hypothetical protein [Candidatus Acidoferrales bacterium]